MKVFLTGGTGAVGRFVVPALVARGHVVTVMARSAEKAAQVKGQGGIPARVDLFDPGGLAAAVAGHQAVLNLATAIPPMHRMGSADAWAPNSRIRTEGSTNLVKAALGAGVERFVQESIAFTYRDRGDAWIAEDAPLETDALTDSSVVAEANGGGLPSRGAATWPSCSGSRGSTDRGASSRRPWSRPLAGPRGRCSGHAAAGSARSTSRTRRPRWSPRSPPPTAPTT